MRVLVLGCGEMGSTAVRDLAEYGPFTEIVVATRREEPVRRLVSELGGLGTRVHPAEANVLDVDRLASLMRGFRVVVNCTGPNYRNEVSVARAAIRARVDLVDINDDFETTWEMLELDEEARRAGILVQLGLGASPGVNNVLVRAAVDQLDAVDEIHTAWVMSASDPGGLALSYHLLHSLSGRAVTVRDGRLVEVESFVDGRERLEFPDPVGSLDVYHVGHPEPITLWRTFPEARIVDDKASFNVPAVNEWIRTLGRMAREAPREIRVDGRRIDAMDFAAAYFHRRCRELTDVPKAGALRVDVRGTRKGRPRRVVFSSAGLISQGTGIPASIGAILRAEGKVEGTGVRPPEAYLDATEFLYEIFTRRNVARLNGWVEDEEPQVAAAR